jgi:hypothetical protein
MPKCINDPKKSYKGIEPSPKGVGFCAHACIEGTIMKGKDGNEWIVKKIKNGSKKWIKVSFNKCNMILYYKKKIGGEFIHGYLNQYSIKFGKIENDKFYPWKSYNKFDKEENIPKNYEQIDIPINFMNEYLCGDNEKIMNELNKIKNKTHYYTHRNGGRPYLVYIINKNVLIYQNKFDISFVKYNNNNSSIDFYYEWAPFLKLDDTLFYSKKVKIYTPKKVFIGKSPLNPMTKFSGGHGSEYDGNSILLHISGNKYIFIGQYIFNFKTDYPIKQFISPVGNSDVVYPYAIDTHDNFYLLIEGVIIKCNSVECREGPYESYYLKSIITSDFQGIDKYYIGKYIYTLNLQLDENDYDRLIKIGSPIYIKKIDGTKVILTKAKYNKLMNDFAKEINVKKLKRYFEHQTDR